MKLTQFITLLELQDELNTRIDPDWRDKQRPWWRAAWLEAAELVESTPWKWWKSGDLHLENVKTEVVDIFHFALSQTIEAYAGDIDAAACELLRASRASLIPNEIGADNIRGKGELLAGCCLHDKFIDVTSMFNLMNAAGLASDELYTRYVAKNVLNLFRQDNGYKEGNYVKQWGAGEDNDFLTGYLSVNPFATPTELKAAMQKEYLAVLRMSALESAK